jgi:acetyl-CoA synthetase
VTTPSLYARKVAPIRDRLPTLRDVLLVGAPGEADAIEGAVDLTTALAAASADFDIVHTTP